MYYHSIVMFTRVSSVLDKIGSIIRRLFLGALVWYLFTNQVPTLLITDMSLPLTVDPSPVPTATRERQCPISQLRSPMSCPLSLHLPNPTILQNIHLINWSVRHVFPCPVHD